MQDKNSPQSQPPTPPPFAAVAQPLGYMTPAVNPYAGRKTALTVFGILLLIAGAFYALSTLASVLMMFVTPSGMGGVRLSPAMMLSTVVVNGLLTFGLIATGIGSVRAKRWVRPVVVPLSVISAIAMGFGATAVLINVINGTYAPAAGLPQGMFVIVGIIMLTFAIVPGVYAWFYASARTRDALWFYDPQISWAEAVPMPVFAISLLSGLGAISLVATLLVPSNPAFGVILRGLLATLATAFTLAALVAVSVLCYRRSMLGWWLAMAVVVLGLASNAANLATGASRQLAVEMIDEMYGPGPYTGVVVQGTSGGGVAANGVPTSPASLPTTVPAALPPPVTTTQIQAQMRQAMREQADSQSAIQMVGLVAMGVVMCGYLLWARKFFAPTTSG